MDRWRLFVTLVAGLSVASAACAHGSDGGAMASTEPDASVFDPHAGESWFSSLKHNETEKDVRQEQEELALHTTTAKLSCASESDMAALDRQGQMLEVRLAIAVARRQRDQARKAGNKKLADKLERKVHGAKLKLLEIAGQASSGTADPD